MESFVRTHAVAAPILRDNVDTDQIAPGMYAANTPREQHAASLFRNMRYLADGSPDPDFILNRAPWTESEILVVGKNFGCGSSREAAAKAMRAFGIRAIIAESFGGILFNNCFRNGIVPVVLPEPTVFRLAEQAIGAPAGKRLTVDLETQSVTDAEGETYAFAVPAQQRTMLLNGLDEIDMTLSLRGELDGFWKADRALRPWVYEPGLAT